MFYIHEIFACFENNTTKSQKILFLKRTRFWKFNTSLITEKNYITRLKEKNNKWKQNYANLNNRIKWNFIKYKINFQLGIVYKELDKKEKGNQFWKETFCF